MPTKPGRSNHHWTLIGALAVFAVPFAAGQAAQAPRVIEVFREFDRIGARPLWPGFDPRSVPVEVYDGNKSYLFHHRNPPEGFHELVGAPGIFVFSGHHEAVRANTGTEVNGLPTATADFSDSTRQSVSDLASLLIHETFHVYEKRAHPKWGANEGVGFTYPFDDPVLLEERRLETLALVRALEAPNDRQARCWAEAALAERGERFGKMPPEDAGYERGTELNEGLAQYVEFLSVGKPAALKPEDFPAGKIRERGYATGQALALLLDRFAPDWKSQMGDTPLDEVLRGALPKSDPPCSFPASIMTADLARARHDVAELVEGRVKRRQEFLNVPGWRLEVVAGREPLWPQGFDPWNTEPLGHKEILHSRWLKVGNGSGAIEVLNHASLTEAAGEHPLFNGVRELIVTGLKQLRVSDSAGKVAIDAPGAKGEFTGTVVRSGQTIRINLP